MILVTGTERSFKTRDLECIGDAVVAYAAAVLEVLGLIIGLNQMFVRDRKDRSTREKSTKFIDH